MQKGKDTAITHDSSATAGLLLASVYMTHSCKQYTTKLAQRGPAVAGRLSQR